MRSRQGLLILSSVLVAATAVGVAQGAPADGAPPGAAKSSAQFALRRDEAGGPDAVAARQRARAGDCAGALASFDAAIRVNVDPTLRRDRGLCHEKLGHPFPAIEDYRAYVTGRPDAPDVDQMRDRLARLEEQVGAGANAARDGEDPNGFKAHGQFSLGTAGGTASSSSSSSHRTSEAPLGPKSGEQERSYDYYAARERAADAASTSAIREGAGWLFGPFLAIPRYFVGKGANGDLGYALGAAVRYSFGPTLSFMSEFGFAGVGTSGGIGSANGPLLMAGLELRVPLTRWASDQLVLGFGGGFERYTVGGISAAVNSWEGRGRIGYRHVFGPVVGLEFLLDGGPAYLVPTGRGDGKMYGLIGGSYAVVIAF